MKDLLIVEDDPTLGEGIRLALQAPELRPQLCRSLADAGDLLSRRSFDLLILDINLPDGNGLDLLRALRRESEIPVILLTANDLETDIVAGLELGADDYITKPFGGGELLARVRAALRHARNQVAGPSYTQTGVYRAGELCIDFDRHLVQLEGQDVHLTQSEYKIVSLLTRYAGKVLTYDFIIREIWGEKATGDTQNLRANMAKIRRKLEKKGLLEEEDEDEDEAEEPEEEKTEE